MHLIADLNDLLTQEAKDMLDTLQPAEEAIDSVKAKAYDDMLAFLQDGNNNVFRDHVPCVCHQSLRGGVNMECMEGSHITTDHMGDFRWTCGLQARL